jgi:type I restriction enzyme, S subunit
VTVSKSLFGNVPKDWTLSHIGDIAILKQGLQISKKLRSDTFKEGYIPLLKITDLPERAFSEYVTDVSDNYIAQKDDIIYTRTGQVGLVYTDVEGCVHNNCFKVIVDYNKFDKNYIYYYLNNSIFCNYSNSIASGSVQKDLTHSVFKTIPIAYPSLEKQKKIGSFLKSLDDKIELNSKMNKTLEEMITALYKHRFVDFGPFQEEELNESEFGMIPEGWFITSFGELFNLIKYTVKPEQLAEEMPYIGLEHMPKGSITLGQWGLSTDITSNKYEFKKFDVLFGKLRPYFKKVGIAASNGICSTDIMVLRPKDDHFYGLLLGTVIQDQFIDYCTSASSGTKMPRVNWNEIKKYPIAIPKAEKEMRNFNNKIIEYAKQIVINVHENNSLTKLRNYLLPRLLSGEIDLNVAETKVDLVV